MSDPRNKSILVMFSGPNGSGKSTITSLFQNQPGFPQKYINPDEIALTLGGDTMSKAYQASAIAAQERFECIEKKKSFSFETVMSHPSKLAILETAREAGFETQVIFVSTDNPLTNVERVRKRVVDGGHNVPENKVVSRYHRSLSLLPKAVEIANKTYIFDNSSRTPVLAAVFSKGQVIERSGTKIEWVERTITTINERRQERLTLEQNYPDSSVASLDRGKYTGKIELVSKHFLVQQPIDDRAVIHENLILGLDRSAIGHDVLISYQDGVYRVAIPEISIDIPESMENTLFDLASSAKYVVLNRGMEGTSSRDNRVYDFPSGVAVEKSSEGLSIVYNDKSIQFDRDYNVIQNDFSVREILQLNQQTQSIKQHILEESRA